ncbi:MAG: WbqC family protein [Acidobacteria bacterium]|nr:WbqC family protein [Acidobacteriota bacterium]
MKKVAIVQSNYIPWKGYFDLIAAVDEFVLYDDVQYTRRDWRNRNQIKTSQGLRWLTVPVKTKDKYLQTIRETEVDGDRWEEVHWESLYRNYRRAPHFEEVASHIQPLYRDHRYTHLSSLNRAFIDAICGYLGITTKISGSWEYDLVDGKTERLVEICAQIGGTEYISGPAARGYIDEGRFVEKGIKLTWFEYSGYLEYPQLWGEFNHHVTILDLMFNCGKEAPRYMKHVQP